MGVQGGGYSQGTGQTPLQPTADLVNDDLQRAANASAEFFNKSNALGHQPDAEQKNKQIHGQIENFDEKAKGQQGFDSEAHRHFMRSLG